MIILELFKKKKLNKYEIYKVIFLLNLIFLLAYCSTAKKAFTNQKKVALTNF